MCLYQRLYGWQIVGLLALKVSLAVHVALGDNVLRRERCGGCFFLGWDALSYHCVLHPPHGPQASPHFLARRVRRRLSPPRAAFSALRGSFLFSLVLYLLVLCTMQCFPLSCLGFLGPFVTLALLIPPPFFPCLHSHSASFLKLLP
jgi:hypothetical protein